MSVATIDLHFMRQAGVIACYRAATPDGGFVLLESGPASTLPALEAALDGAGLALGQLRAVFVTHAHLDHAGAAGTLARRSGCAVWCHPLALPHLADPARLLASARRLYGELLEPLWGRTEPVPEDRLEAVGDGQVVTVGGLEVTGWHTPGHALHHVVWQVGGDVATGDVAGIRIPGCPHVMPPTPPPDIDVEVWRSSLRGLAELAPERLLLTHFGAHDDPQRHLEELERRLLDWADLTAELLGGGADRDALERALLAQDDRELAEAGAGPDTVQLYRGACPMEMNAAGLDRWWRTRTRT